MSKQYRRGGDREKPRYIVIEMETAVNAAINKNSFGLVDGIRPYSESSIDTRKHNIWFSSEVPHKDNINAKQLCLKSKKRKQLKNIKKKNK